MPLRLNPSLVPPFGWSFNDTNGVLYRASSLEGLINEVTRARAQRGEPTDGVEAEIHEDICSKRPDLCREVRVVDVANGKPSLTHRIFVFLARLAALKKRGLLKSVVEHDRGVPKRVAECQTCKHNVPIPTNCAPCVNAVLLARKGSGLPEHPSLRDRVCDWFGEDLGVSVLIAPASLSDGEPHECWRGAKTPL